MRPCKLEAHRRTLTRRVDVFEMTNSHTALKGEPVFLWMLWCRIAGTRTIGTAMTPSKPLPRRYTVHPASSARAASRYDPEEPHTGFPIRINEGRQSFHLIRQEQPHHTTTVFPGAANTWPVKTNAFTDFNFEEEGKCAQTKITTIAHSRGSVWVCYSSRSAPTRRSKRTGNNCPSIQLVVFRA